MRVALGHFARSGIEAHLGADLPAGVQAALCHYWRRLRSGRTAIELPRGGRGLALDRSGASFELPVEAEMRLTLEHEAERQATTVDRVLLHAVLLYLAHLDASTPPPQRPGANGRRPSGRSPL
jgi:hypothetical protein